MILAVISRACRAFFGTPSDDDILSLLREKPGQSGYHLTLALREAGKPSSTGGLYVVLDRLERRGLIWGEWERDTPPAILAARGGNRRRLYYAMGSRPFRDPALTPNEGEGA